MVSPVNGRSGRCASRCGEMSRALPAVALATRDGRLVGDALQAERSARWKEDSMRRPTERTRTSTILRSPPSSY